MTGTIQEVSSPVVRWQVTVGDETFNGASEGVVEVEHDGARVRITASGDVLRGKPARTRHAWSEMVERYKLAPSTIPPFTEAVLELVELAPGVRVDIAAEVTERGFDGDGGPRTAPKRHVRAARALVIGIGDGAAAEVDRALAKPTPAPTPADVERWWERALARLFVLTAAEVVEVLMIVVTAALLVIAATQAEHHAAIAFSLGTVALFLGLHPAAQVEPFFAREKPFGRAVHLALFGRCTGFLAGLFGLLMGLGISTGFVPTGPEGTRDGPAVIVMFALAAIGSMLIGDLVARPTLQRLAALAGKGAALGRLRTRKSVTLGGRPAALGRWEVWKTGWTTDSQNRTKSTIRCVSTHYSAVPSIEVETTDGPITIDTSQLAWTSTIRFRDTTRTDGGYDVVQPVPEDARVVVCGSREPGPPAALRARGTEPVYLLAGPDDPARWARRVVRLRWLARLAMVASIPGLLWASGWLA